MKRLATWIMLIILSSCHFFNGHKSVELVYGDWPIDHVLGNLVKVIVEENFDTDVDLMMTNAAGAWAAISTGTADICLGAWLPTTSRYYYANTKNRVDLLNPIYVGTRIGLAVPKFVSIDSIAELSSHAPKFQNRIMGIEPGAGIMVEVEKAMKTYNLSEFELIDVNETVMLNMLKQDYRNRDWIVIVAWEPHEMFLQFDLKFLEDPKKVFGDEQAIHSFVRLGFRDDYPQIYQFLKNFNLTKTEMSEMLQKNHDNNRPYENAIEWVRSHPEKVKDWLGN
jgi:glycine betaine/proline transport system substrate-binding protein